ncbi:YqiA/YcfP family alpha/beta fold hydrolase [Helicobacter mesocricetorum]|uniref:YqiA/YcfP family alpha/beta fold hydrolase n=1 Tax=Helicobacter mesocricetorum TaxID=87012 RepID=UPI000CF06BB7|nr:YqiA/YcfP family alpha/beta fold hydrolase [Helicobacter mesocricetorum]
MLLYLHGFRSVGLCYKGTIIRNFSSCSLTPNLPYVPTLAIEFIQSLIEKYQKQHKICLIGSSLGGYYATFLAEKYHLKAILVNPVVDGYKTLLPAVGRIHIPYSNETFLWTLDLALSLKQYFVENITPSLYYVMLQKGDKVLNYRNAAQKFKDSKILLQEGGSHRFENFQDQKDSILQWANGIE